MKKYLILGVAFDWGIRKGLDVFIQLSRELDTSKYQIVLVGTNDEIDRKLPDTIISIHRTQNQQELAEIYTAADLFVNPTREDNYPTVNMESLACGTPVLTFDTGGSAEVIDNNTGKSVCDLGIRELAQKIEFLCENKPYKKSKCTVRAQEFDKKQRFDEYIKLYEELEHGRKSSKKCRMDYYM